MHGKDRHTTGNGTSVSEFIKNIPRSPHQTCYGTFTVSTLEKLLQGMITIKSFALFQITLLVKISSLERTLFDIKASTLWNFSISITFASQ